MGARIKSDQLNGQCTKEIGRWMHRKSAQLSVDVMLADPFESIRMGLTVGVRVDLLDQASANVVKEKLEDIYQQHPEIVATVSRICRTAMNARKRGELKPTSPKRGGPRS